MSAVIGKLYSPLPSFKTSSPWNNSNAGPQGWPIRWVARWRICLSVWSNGVYIFGHFVAVLWHRRSRWFLLRNEDFQAIQLTVPLSLCEQCAEKNQHKTWQLFCFSAHRRTAFSLFFWMREWRLFLCSKSPGFNSALSFTHYTKQRMKFHLT